MIRRPCTASTKQGRACRAFAPDGGDLCRVHDPARADQVQAARSKGGKLCALKGRRLKLESPSTLARFLSALAQDCLSGTVEPDVTRAVVYTCATLRQVVETSELEKRLASLEQRLAEGGRKWA
jgi:hypothetical protein